MEGSKKKLSASSEAVFDLAYLILALSLGLSLCWRGQNLSSKLAGVLALVLVGGDLFHLVPRLAVIFTAQAERWRSALGWGKFVSSLSMTVFYLLLWQYGQLVYQVKPPCLAQFVVYASAALRLLLCLHPGNRWGERFSPRKWLWGRNLPFLILGLCNLVFFSQNQSIPALQNLWLAILLSFAFYIPVVLGAEKYPPLGMLMLPKTVAYLWMLAQFWQNSII